MSNYPEHIITAAVRMRREGLPYDKIAVKLSVSKTLIRKAIKEAIGSTPAARTNAVRWTDDEHRLLVELAPTGLGGVGIADRLGTKTKDQVYRHADRHGIEIEPARDWANPCTADIVRPLPPSKSEAVFAGISFRAPTDRPVRGVARPTRGPGRVPMRPATRVAGVSPLGAIASGGGE